MSRLAVIGALGLILTAVDNVGTDYFSVPVTAAGIVNTGVSNITVKYSLVLRIAEFSVTGCNHGIVQCFFLMAAVGSCKILATVITVEIKVLFIGNIIGRSSVFYTLSGMIKILSDRFITSVLIMLVTSDYGKATSCIVSGDLLTLNRIAGPIHMIMPLIFHLCGNLDLDALNSVAELLEAGILADCYAFSE